FARLVASFRVADPAARPPVQPIERLALTDPFIDARLPRGYVSLDRPDAALAPAIAARPSLERTGHRTLAQARAAARTDLVLTSAADRALGKLAAWEPQPAVPGEPFQVV